MNCAGGRPTRSSKSGLGSQKGRAWRPRRQVRPIVFFPVDFWMRYQRMAVRRTLKAESRLRSEMATQGGRPTIHFLVVPV